MASFKKEINELFRQQKQTLRNLTATYLNESFKLLFEKYPALKSIKVNGASVYNDSDYSNVVHKDCETVKINGYSYIDLDDQDWDDDEEYISNIGITREQHEAIAEDVETILNDIDDDIFNHVYGTSFGLLIEKGGVSMETSDIEY